MRTGLAVVLVMAYVLIAYFSQGNPAASVQLNDASVWVVRSSHDEVARLNHQVEQLDAQVTPQGRLLDVLQQGSAVFTYAEELGQLRPLDVASVSLASPVKLPPGAAVSLGGSTLSVASGGDAWVLPSAGVVDFNAKRPTLTGLGAGGSAVVTGLDGVVHAYSVAEQTMTNVTLNADGTTSSQSEGMATSRSSQTVQLTAVGGTPVVLDQAAHMVTVPGQSPVPIPTGQTDPQSVQIQQPGPSSSVVYVASDRGLYSVPLSGGPASRVPGSYRVSGQPAAPVVDDGCVNAAWARSANYLYSCSAGTSAVYPIPGLQSQAKLVFRVNRSIVVLNDSVNGQVWTNHNGLQQVANWDQFESALNPSFANSQGNSAGPNDTSQPDQPPHAVPVQLGARPGRTTDLPVPIFDSDPNGDVLTLLPPAPIPSTEGTLQVADNGTVFRFTPAPGLSGSVKFPYSVTDGRGGNDTASSTVTVTVESPGTNAAPRGLQSPTYHVTDGKTIQFDPLGSWYDPDGDAYSLTGVSTPAGDVVSFTPAGQVTFFASGGAGTQVVTLDVTDSLGATGHQTVTIDIGPSNQLLPPATVPFLARATAGQATVLHPLSVDSDPNDVPMRLASVSPPNANAAVPGLEFTPNYVNGDIQFLAPNPGTYYLQYVATDVPPVGSPQSSPPTAIRIDVVDPNAAGPPVAMDQVAYLTAGGSTLLPVLDSASDPAGRVLVVQSVSAPYGSPVLAAVYQGSQVRLSTASNLTGPQLLSYTVSDGTRVATAQIQVLPAAQPATILPPVAEPMTAVVRAGDVGQLDPLANDFDPHGDPMELAPGSVSVNHALTTFAGSDVGDAFIDGGIVRYRAPAVAGQATILYGVTDASGQQATSSITVTVTPDQAVTQPPTPEPLTASVLAGTEVVIPVPLAGLDPSGESVTLVGPTQGPKLGRVVSVNQGSMVYQAFPQSAGTDTFAYAIRDFSGLVGQSVVSIGVAPAAPIDIPPVAVPQEVNVKAGRTVDVPVLAKDFDPQGYAISFAPGHPLQTTGTTASIVGSDIEVVAPATPSHRATVNYTITDGHGATALGVLTVVTVTDPTFAAPPLAQDIVVTSLSTPNAIAVPVDVLSHVTNPDGPASDLQIVGFAGQIGPAPDSLGNGSVAIHLATQPQIIVYTVKNLDGQASATISVPARNSDIPVLRASAASLSTPENTPLTVSVGDYILDPGGKALRLTSASGVSAAEGSGSADSPTTATFHPNPGYVGPASLTVTVTNGSNTDDPTAQTGVFTLPIAVTGSGAPPTFYGPTLTAVLGDHATFDLSPYIGNPNPGGAGAVRLSSPLSPPAGLGASISGQSLSVLPQGLPLNSVQAVTFTMTADGSPPVTAEVDVVIASTLKPLAVAVPQSATVFQGQSVTVSVLDQDVDPFPTPLTVSNPQLVNGQGRVTTDGSTVTYTASPSFVGTAAVAYTLTDQTKESNRQVQGTITITVSGRPGAPGSPSVLGFGDGKVLLSWSAPPDNGQSIDHYTVTGGPLPQICPATTCTITGLQDGTSYQFAVSAHNVVGDGPPSQPSAPIVPNIVPQAPSAPTLKYENGAMLVSWAPPVDTGTPITCYQVAISPVTGSSPPCITGLSYNWTGLVNGDAYTFTVRAENSLGWGPFSSSSLPETPSTVPSPPPAPTVQAVPNDPTGQKLDVQWGAVTGTAANGSPVSSYALSILQGGSLVRTDQIVPTSGTQNPIIDLVSGLSDKISYSFTVTATNRAGTSSPSPASAPFTVFGQPAAVTNLAAASNQDRSSTLSFTPPDSNGQAISSYLVSVDGGSFTPLASNDVVAGLTNGTNHSFVVEACNTYCSSPSNKATATPDAAPSMPAVTGSVSGTTFSFNWGAPSSNGCPITQEGWSQTGGPPWTGVGVGAGGTGSIGGGYNQTITVTLFAQDACGLSATSSGSATSGSPPPPPNPTVSISQGAPSNACNSGPTNCFWVNVSGSNFPAGQNITFSCADSGGQFWVNPGANPGYPNYGPWYNTGSGSFGWAVTSNPGRGCAHTSGAYVSVTVTAGGASATGSTGNF
jgi:hypothetical protein